MDYRQKILSLTRSAPVLPTQVAKSLGIDSLMSGAMLSEMVSKGLLRVSRLKVGGSPVYYAPDHPEHLKEFMSHLNEKDRKTAALLEEKGVLRDRDQDPVVRVGLQNLRDFAVPLTVQYGGQEELFYQWFLLSEEAARERIRELIDPQEKKLAPKIEVPAKLPDNLPSEPPSPPPKPTQKPKRQDSDIVLSAESFFAENDIRVVDKTVLKKNDIDFLVDLPSPVGPLRYFCKVRGKKRVADADLSNAYVQGQLKKLPVLFLTSGELAKSARELLPQLKGLVVKKV